MELENLVSFHIRTYDITIPQELSSFLQELEKRFDSAQRGIRKRVVGKEERIESVPLNSVPPPASTRWTVDKEWHKGHHSTHLL